MDIRPPHQIIAWLGPLIIINIFIWVVAWTPAANEAVCAKSDNCLTDWIGALSGWVATVAAYLTITTMNRQRQEASRYQREFVELEIMARLALARRVRRKLGRRAERCRNLRQSVIELSPETSVERMVRLFRSMKSTIERDADLVNEYADKIGMMGEISSDDLSMHVAIVEGNITASEQMPENHLRDPVVKDAVRLSVLLALETFYDRAAQYYGELDSEAERFIRTWSARI